MTTRHIRCMAFVSQRSSSCRRCAAGESVVDPELAVRALRAGGSSLSSREEEMLGACAEGLSTAELATRFWLSEGTIRNRVSEILGNSEFGHASRPSRSPGTTAGSDGPTPEAPYERRSRPSSDAD